MDFCHQGHMWMDQNWQDRASKASSYSRASKPLLIVFALFISRLLHTCRWITNAILLSNNQSRDSEERKIISHGVWLQPEVQICYYCRT